MTLDWTDNLLRAEKGDECTFCLKRNPLDLRAGVNADVRYVGLDAENGFDACRRCLNVIADALDAARPKKTRHLCPECKGSGAVSGTFYEPGPRACSTCDGKRLVVIRAAGPLKTLEAVPSPSDEDPVVPGQEDPA